MRPDEFLYALDLLPDPLRDRAVALRAYARVTRCEDCQRIGDAVRLALTAAHYDELGSARQLLDVAEQQAARPRSTARSRALNAVAARLVAGRRRPRPWSPRPTRAGRDVPAASGTSSATATTACAVGAPAGWTRRAPRGS
ncbi:hypothetical protein [Micromonospora sp. NPDC023814]|uniref:hypothetical protein n=1 Tax=Micromonospora sp. NPDC023814 TaxID=3154596 RepID=UPI0033E9BD4E